MPTFELEAPHQPKGDQPNAIRELVEGLRRGDDFQTLLGATGTGKTFTIAHAIAHHGRPALIMSHNKTLAAQLYGEIKQLFPRNAVEYFISYYDYYQPEAYVPATDTYIEKDASINEDIDRLRLRATSALQEREDVIVVASVSCIYGLGNPREYRSLMLTVERGEEVARREILEGLVNIQYERSDLDFVRGTFRARGDTVDVFPAYEEQAIRIELWGDEVERITRFDPVTGELIVELERAAVYPATHFVTRQTTIERAIPQIEAELEERIFELENDDRLLEAQRLEQRTRYDIEMMREMGFCPGIENYSRFLSGREPGERPFCLLDYFPDDYVMIVDESHQTIPQLHGMYRGDRSRKQTLVEHGFRLPSALDNRPLKFEEWKEQVHQAIFVSATPGEWELEASGGVVVEQIIRPTGLVDPAVEVRPVRGQVDDLLAEIREREERNERVLVTTLTKRMAEDLAEYLQSLGVRVGYMHSDIDAIERVDILRALRLGKIDVLVGINLLREGLDLPEVSLVGILDADKEGFLRDERSLIQTIGRAARNVNGMAIMYADTVTESMRRCIDETERRREIQIAHNEEHGITPETIRKSVEEITWSTRVADAREEPVGKVAEEAESYQDEVNREEYIKILEAEMEEAAEKLDFERAALLRDRLFELRAEGETEGDDEAGRREGTRRTAPWRG